MQVEKTDCVVFCQDILGCIVVFEKKNYDKHKRKHAELRLQSFCPDRIVQTLKKPTFTIKGQQTHTLCYYLEEFEKDGIMRYTKVIVHEEHRSDEQSPICYVKTAFRIDHVQELKYGYKPKYY